MTLEMTGTERAGYSVALRNAGCFYGGSRRERILV